MVILNRFYFYSVEPLRLFAFTLMFGLLAPFVSAQTNEGNSSQKAPTFITYETIASFKGGNDSLAAFLSQYISGYQHWSKADSTCEKVLVLFQLDSLGTLLNFSIQERPEHAPISEEVRSSIEQAFQDMPPWIPCTFAGKACECRMMLPIALCTR